MRYPQGAIVIVIRRSSPPAGNLRHGGSGVGARQSLRPDCGSIARTREIKMTPRRIGLMGIVALQCADSYGPRGLGSNPGFEGAGRGRGVPSPDWEQERAAGLERLVRRDCPGVECGDGLDRRGRAQWQPLGLSAQRRRAGGHHAAGAGGARRGLRGARLGAREQSGEHRARRLPVEGRRWFVGQLRQRGQHPSRYRACGRVGAGRDGCAGA